jgi:transcriptional regulator with XRE-family HTH domain
MEMRRAKSPIRDVRERRGWRAADLAIFAGMSIGAITMAERGELAKLPVRLEAALIRLGIDVEEVRQQHAEFVETRRRDLELRAIRAPHDDQ